MTRVKRKKRPNQAVSNTTVLLRWHGLNAVASMVQLVQRFKVFGIPSKRGEKRDPLVEVGTIQGLLGHPTGLLYHRASMRSFTRYHSRNRPIA
jgi:hypothetical protein